MSYKDSGELREIISDLKDTVKLDDYAKKENITFFESLRNPLSFLCWLIFKMPKIKGEQLLELSDFHLSEGKWEKILQKELRDLEANKFLDILRPLKKEILTFIKSNRGRGETLIIVNIGSGSMEIEKQLIRQLQKENIDKKIIFIGLDNSKASIAFAKENLALDNIELKVLDNQNIENDLGTLKSKSEQFQITVCNLNAFDLEHFKIKPDLIFHSKLKHHLPQKNWKTFDNLLLRICPNIIEFDDYKSFFVIMFSVIMNWNKPVLNNGAIFSCLRSIRKSNLNKFTLDDWGIRIQLGSYLKYHYGNNQ